MRQMKLIGFLQAQNCSNYPASWRHPLAQASLPYADVCENNELRTYCISIKPLSTSGGMAERFYNF